MLSLLTQDREPEHVSTSAGWDQTMGCGQAVAAFSLPYEEMPEVTPPFTAHCAPSSAGPCGGFRLADMRPFR